MLDQVPSLHQIAQRYLASSTQEQTPPYTVSNVYGASLTGFKDQFSIERLEQLDRLPGGDLYKKHNLYLITGRTPHYTDDQLPSSQMDSNYREYKYFIPPGTLRHQITGGPYLNYRYCGAFRLGSPPERTAAIEPAEYLSIISTPTNRVSEYKQFVGKKDVLRVGMPNGRPGYWRGPEWSSSALTGDFALPTSIDCPPLAEGNWAYFRLLNPTNGIRNDDALRRISPVTDINNWFWNDPTYWGYFDTINRLEYQFLVDRDIYKAWYSNARFDSTGDPVAGVSIQNSNNTTTQNTSSTTTSTVSAQFTNTQQQQLLDSLNTLNSHFNAAATHAESTAVVLESIVQMATTTGLRTAGNNDFQSSTDLYNWYLERGKSLNVLPDDQAATVLRDAASRINQIPKFK